MADFTSPAESLGKGTGAQQGEPGGPPRGAPWGHGGVGVGTAAPWSHRLTMCS